ncbi:MAG: addiction module protein [Planctomycetota bacterium]|nr:addiction module protein [Planctomycetota bacterium]
MLDSLDDEPVDEGVAEAGANEVLARSAAYSRGELKAVDWREALQEMEAELNKISPIHIRRDIICP